MRAPPNVESPAPLVGGNRAEDHAGKRKQPTNTPGRRSNQVLVGTIDTGHASQVRLHLSTWREQTKLELKPYSATVPQCFMPCGPGISIDITLLPELLKAIAAAEAEGKARGLL